MKILQELHDKAEEIGAMGTEARVLGVSSYYIDPFIGDGIVQETPDGNKIILSVGSTFRGLDLPISPL